MAEIKVIGPRWLWRGFVSGWWVTVEAKLNNSEATKAAAGVGAAAISGTALPPPANIIIPVVLGSYAAQIADKNEENGVIITVNLKARVIPSVLPDDYEVDIASR